HRPAEPPGGGEERRGQGPEDRQAGGERREGQGRGHAAAGVVDAVRGARLEQVAEVVAGEVVSGRVRAAGAAGAAVGHRARGGDGVPGAADDDAFDTLAELDAVPFVGPRAFSLLLEYARGHGLVRPAGVLELGALPPGVPAELVAGLASDDSLAIDGNPRTL